MLSLNRKRLKYLYKGMIITRCTLSQSERKKNSTLIEPFENAPADKET